MDDGTLPDRRGSLTVDDEGTPSGRTVLIEDGILVGYLQDRLNARLMGMRATGNGRRQSYAHAPMPRMTNTVMLSGGSSADEMIASVARQGLQGLGYRVACFTRPEEALDAFQMMGAHSMVPMHHDTFPLGGEPMHEPAERLMKAAFERGLEQRVRLLHEGESAIY